MSQIGYTFLPCVLAGLSKAPQYVLNKSEVAANGCIWVDDVDSVILPLDACGGDGTLAFARRTRRVTTVKLITSTVCIHGSVPFLLLC